MKKIHALIVLLFLSTQTLLAQIPIVYYDFENNASRGTLQNAVEMSVNTAPAGSVFSYAPSAGACNAIDCSNAQGKAGAGQIHGGSIEGYALTSGAWQQVAADPGISAVSYFQFVANTTGFNGISLTFDAKFGNGSAPTSVGVLISNNGTTWTFVGSTNTTNGNTIPAPSGLHSWGFGNFNLTAASAIANNNGNLYVRIYCYGASAGGNGAYFSLDNVTLLATSTVAGKVFTTLDENNYYTGYTSGLTGTTLGRGGFAVTGAGTNVTINTTSGLRMNSGQTLSVASSGTVTFGSTGTLSGTGGIFNIASGATLVTAHTGGISGSVTTTGTNVYSPGAHYTFNAATATPFPTGTFGSTGNVTINPGAGAGVSLNISPTINGTLSFGNGKLNTGNNTLTLNGTVSGMSATNVIAGSATSNMIIGGSGALGTLYLDQTTPGTTNLFNTFTLNRASSGIATLGNALRVGGGGLNLTNGTLADGGYIITLAGNITGTGSHSGSGKITMVSSGATISSASLGNLELNNAGGFSLSGSPAIGGTLTLASGKLSLSTHNLILGLASAISGTPSAAAMIVANSTGQVRKLFSSNGTFLFPIGDNTNYTPITLQFTGGSYAVGAYCGANVKTVKHPNNANTTDYLNRYWSVATSGITAPVYSILSAIYATTDVTGTESNISAGQYNGTLPWVKFGTANTATNTLSSASVTNINSDFTGITTAAPVVSSSANTAICTGGSTDISASGAVGDPTLTYSWSPASGLSATTGTTVTASPVATTTYTLTISDGNGFSGTATTTVSVNPLPPITGNTSVCIGISNTLSNATTGGTWASSNIANATIDPSMGIVTGVAAGTATITYTASPGCVVTTEVTVLPLPSAITGMASVCTGNTTTLAQSVSGGTWTSSASATASVDAATGVVTGVAAGTATITYMLPTGCIITRVATVHPVPAAISGTTSICIGSVTTLSHSDGGGTWSSSATSIATVNAAGEVAGIEQGTATITYTVPAGCTTTTDVTVNPLPAAIDGAATVCEEATTTLTNTVASGTWSIFPVSVATINSSGLVTGLAAGNATILYTLPTGCSISKTITVNVSPAAIDGIEDVCIGETIGLENTTAGGTWSSDAESIATTDINGNVTGVSNGIANIIYTLPNGCSKWKAITVNALPDAITGTMNVCINSTTTLSTTSTGGTWSSTDPSVSVTATTGIVTGIAEGTAIITYILSTGCSISATVTVHPLPEAITGISEVCVNGNTALYNTTAGGTWGSTNTGIATVSGAGIVLGISNGVAEIVYTLPTGCAAITTLTVNPLPDAITGSLHVCTGLTTTLSSTSPDGTWSSSNNDIATINGSGVLSGLSAGNVTVSYTIATGCSRSVIATVYPLPTVITGDMEICAGSTTYYTNSSGGGMWNCTCIEPGLAINASGIFSAGSAGTTTISYVLPTGCFSSAVLTINPLPASINGETEVCEGLSVMLSSADAGGVWSSADANVNVNAATGEITGNTAGTATITYTILSTGCFTTTVVTVHALPTTISGTLQACTGQSSALTSTPTGGTWSSSHPSIATANTDGTILGADQGTATITYTSPAGCIRSATFTVHPLPAAIADVTPVCIGLTTTLSNPTAGGTWSSNDADIATINATGLLTGIGDGNTTISYTLPTGCYITAEATVNVLPDAITGIATVCNGLSTLLSTTTTAGEWSSQSDLIATVNTTGNVTGVSEGTTNITYTILGTGCYTIRTITVNPLPAAIIGNNTVCLGFTATLNNTSSGGTWSSNNTAVASVLVSTGVVTGESLGNTDITYTLPTGCIATTNITVNPLPDMITGIASACAGQSSALSNADASGTWSSGATAIANIDATGLVSAFAAGDAAITFTAATGCSITRVFTVHPLPLTFGGAMQVCEGLTTTISNTLTGGSWISSNVTIADIDPVSGMVSGFAAGTTHITYTLATGCQSTEIFTVNPAVPDITGTGTVCQGLSTTLSNAATGGTWLVGNTTIAAASTTSGIVTGINAGTSSISYILPTGCIATSVLTVNPLPDAITGSSAVCVGFSNTLSSTTAGGLWNSSATSIATVDDGGVVSGLVAGSAIISYTLPTGCLRTKSIVVNPLPTSYTLTGGGSYCAGGTGVNIGLSATDPSIQYHLYRGAAIAGTLSGTGAAVGFGSFTTAGTYTVNATNTATGCVNGMTGSVVVTITPLITPSVSITSSLGDTLCGGNISTFTATPTNGGSTPAYEWLINNVSVGTGSSYVYAPVNGDTVMVKLTSSEACPSPAVVMATKKMTIVANHMPTINITKTSSDSVCQFAEARFVASAMWGGTAPVYTWLRNGIEVGSGLNYNYVPSDGDVISCRLTSNYRCRLANTATSSGITLNVDTTYVPTVTLNAYPGLVIAPSTIATLTATVTGAGPAPVYQWRLNGTLLPLATSAVFTSTFSNNDVVTCLVYGSGPCGLPSFNMVTMTVMEGASVTEVSDRQTDIKLLPNPNNGAFTILGYVGTTTQEYVDIQVTDMLGHTVHNSKIITVHGMLNEKINLKNNLPNGMYLLHFITNTERKTLHFVLNY